MLLYADFIVKWWCIESELIYANGDYMGEEKWREGMKINF